MSSPKARARKAVSIALAKGRLTRPECCERCGTNPGEASDGRSLIHAHHHDHSKPLEVEWICYKCHQQETDAEGAYFNGERHPKAKLSDADISKIREMRNGGMMQRDIAGHFGITTSYASKLYLGRRRAAI